MRLIREVSFPADWKFASSERRLSEIVEWQRESLHSKHHLTLPDHAKIELINSFSSIEHHQADLWRKQAIRNCWGAMPQDHLLNGVIVNDSTNSYSKITVIYENCSKIRLADIRCNLIDLDMVKLLHKVKNSTVEVLEFEENEFSLAVKCDTPAVLVANVLSDTGWQVTAVDSTGQNVPVDLRNAGDLHLAVEVPAGETKLHFRYCPREFWIGLWISALSWSGLAVALSWNWVFAKS